jgi:signal transduction histidine kinase
VIVGAAFAFMLVAISSERDSERQASRSLQELALVNQLETLVIDLETGVRGFVITHEERFLEPWQHARAAFPGPAGQLVRLADDPAEARLARGFPSQVGSYVDDYLVPLVAAAKRNDPSASSLETTAEGKRRVDALREGFDRYRTIERAVLAQRQSRSSDASRRAIVGAATGLVGSVVLIAVVAVYLSRAIVVPVRRAAVLSRRLASGDFSGRMPEVAVGEIGSLERSFNVMAGSLEANRDELRLLADEQAALRTVATLVARGEPTIDVFNTVAAEVRRLLGADGTTLIRYETDDSATILAAGDDIRIMPPVGTRVKMQDENVAKLVWQTGTAARVDASADASDGGGSSLRESGVRVAVGAPIVVEDRLWGAVIAIWTRCEPPTANVRDRIAQFTELVATAVANADSRAQLNESRARIVVATDETRRRIERDLHDGTQQRLVSLALALRGTESMVPPGVPELSAQLAYVARGLTAAVEDLQEFSRGIHPAVLSRGGLGPALKTLARRSPVPVELELVPGPRLPERVEVAVYYVVAETLTNAAKHAHATVVHIDLETDDATVQLAIRDDGVGGAEQGRGSGLVGLRDRVEALGGTIKITSPPGSGTSLLVTVPLDQR